MAYLELYEWIGQKGYQPYGAPLVLYFNAPGQIPDEETDLGEVLVPLSDEVDLVEPDEQGRGVRMLQATRAAVITHKGPYEELGKA